MKIAFVNLWPNGGMRHYSDALVNILSEKNEILYCTNYGDSIACKVRSFPITLDFFKFKNVLAAGELISAIRDFKPDIIHVNSGFPSLLPLYPVFSFFRSVVTVHDAVPHEGEKIVKKMFHYIQLLSYSLFFTRIIVHSEKIKNQLPSFVSRKKVYVMQHVNYGHLAKNVEPKVKISNKFTVLFFGRILKYKGLEYLVRAFDDLDPDRFELVIAGEGQIDVDVTKENVRVINRFVTDSEMAGLFQGADVVVTPYLSASQSGVIYLAFAFGKPVITTNVGALGEIVRNGQNGIVIIPKSADALRDAIQRISESEYYSVLKNNILNQNVSTCDEIGRALERVYAQ
jgi:alpha-maltose-1-phosphate synthase